MATAKKKTAAKKASKRTKSAAAKTSSKTTKKVSAAKKTVPRLELMRRFHLFVAGISALIAVAAIFVLGDQAYNFTTAYSDKDVIASETQTVLGTAHQTVATVEFKYMVAGIFALSAVLSLLLATTLRARYEAGIKNSTSGLRWIFTGVIAGLIVEATTLLTGVEDLITLKLVAGLIVATAVLRWLVERDIKNGSPKWGAFILSAFTAVLAWLPAVAAVVGTHLYGMERYGWHVYALVVLIIAAGIKFGVIQYRFVKNASERRDYVRVEEKYLSNELFIKLAFAAVVFAALID
jgi:hypothetical protein